MIPCVKKIDIEVPEIILNISLRSRSSPEIIYIRCYESYANRNPTVFYFTAH